MDAKRALTVDGLRLKSNHFAQMVEFVFEQSTRLNAFSFEGPVEKVVFISRNGEEEFQVILHKKLSGSLKSYGTA